MRKYVPQKTNDLTPLKVLNHKNANDVQNRGFTLIMFLIIVIALLITREPCFAQ